MHTLQHLEMSEIEVSQGPGKIERVMRKLFEKFPEKTWSAIELAALLYEDKLIDGEYVSDAQHSAVRRALANLQRQGHAFAGPRSGSRDGRRLWGGKPVGLEQYRKSDRQVAREVGLSPGTIAKLRRDAARRDA